MITMNRKLYDALRSIGIADTQAADVSEAITEDLQGIRTELTHFQAEARSEFRVLRWMLGVNLSLTLGVVWLLVR